MTEKGFSLFEVVIALALTAMLILSTQAVLESIHLEHAKRLQQSQQVLAHSPS
jgi:prepilin-type N-terminal cleavage/methylation domain-containing protein